MSAQVQTFSTIAMPAEETAAAKLNRREFLTYAWGAALALATLETGAATFFYLWPRFRPGEFGGVFDLGAATALPALDAAPQPVADGKFWLVNTAAGPKALYMVCTHLGCLYKWEPAENRFRCPCHGSEYDREGNVLQGPTRRALDQFRVYGLVDGQKIAASAETPAGLQPPQLDAQAQVMVDTGDKIVGLTL